MIHCRKADTAVDLFGKTKMSRQLICDNGLIGTVKGRMAWRVGHSSAHSHLASQLRLLSKSQVNPFSPARRALCKRRTNAVGGVGAIDAFISRPSSRQ